MSAEFAIDPAKVREWKRYPEYKDSGVEWLGEVPEHWDVAKLRYVCRFAYGDSLPADAREDGEVPVYGSNGSVATHKNPNTHQPVVIVGRKGSYGKVNYSEQAVFAIDTTYFIDNRYTRNDLRWLFYILGILGLDTVSKDSAIPGLSREDAYDYFLVIPQIAEQQFIATFLVRETARIDALIERKQRFIELLEEKRQVLITQAVTKGLDPDAEMKDSGVEWLGEVPAGWTVVKNRILLDSIEQGWSPLAEDRIAEEDEWAVIKLNAVSKGRFHPLEHKVLSTGYDGKDSWKIDTGDFLITRSNTPDLVGDVCLVESVDGKKLIISDLVYKLVYSSRSVDPAFMKYWMLSKAGRYQIVRDARGSSMSMVKISQGIVNSWYVLLPPLSKQHTIAAFLDRETTQVDALIHILTQQIEKLHEYRTALISAAVTGKIDVRGEVPAAP